MSASKPPWIAPDLAALIAPLHESAILALTLFAEARSEPIEGIVCVGNCVQSRATDAKSRWPRTVREVCLQPWQFSCWHRFPNGKGEDGNYARLMETATLLSKGTDPKNAGFEECAAVATMLMKHALRDRAKGANHYHSQRIARPNWAQGVFPVVSVGGHHFYKL